MLRIERCLQSMLSGLVFDLQRLRLDLENEKRTTAITMEHSNQVRADDQAVRAEVQRLKDELTTMHAQSETEKRAIISEWQATRDNMAANHLQDVMKLSNEARDKQLALGREHEEILARTDHQHRMQMQDKEREFTEKMAEAAKQLKDELTRDKMQWMAQNAATESDLITIAEIARARGVELLGKVLSYKQERDFLRLELMRLKCGFGGAEHVIEPEDRESTHAHRRSLARRQKERMAWRPPRVFGTRETEKERLNENRRNTNTKSKH